MHAAEFFNILAQNPHLDFLESFKEAVIFFIDVLELEKSLPKDIHNIHHSN